MRGWVSDAAIAISRRNRSAAAGEHMWCIALSATWRPSRRSRARYTVAMPPRPSSRSSA